MKAAEAVTINIRTRTRQRDLIDRAAQRVGRSRSEFMLDAALRQAEDVLLDQTFFVLDAEAFEKFQRMLAAPPVQNEGLDRLLAAKTPWE